MIIFNGKAKDLTYKMLLYIAYFQLANPMEKLEPEDFSKN